VWGKIVSKTCVKCLTLEVYAKVRKWGQHVLLATCDVELLGKILREGKIVFEIREEFYEGAKMAVEEVIDLMEQSTIVNMVGHNVVKKAIEKGLVHPDAVLEISGVPHAQIVKM
jgi:hypothetical protein